MIESINNRKPRLDKVLEWKDTILVPHIKEILNKNTVNDVILQNTLIYLHRKRFWDEIKLYKIADTLLSMNTDNIQQYLLRCVEKCLDNIEYDKENYL